MVNSMFLSGANPSLVANQLPVQYVPPTPPIASVEDSSSGSPTLPLSFIRGGGLKSSINSLGTQLGFAPGKYVYTQAGALPWQTAGAVANPAAAGTAGVQAASMPTFGSFLGGAGIGAFAGGLNPLADNKTGGSIGGAIGGGLGSFGGPLGIAAGTFLGSTVGGLFGSDEPKMNASVFNLQTSNDYDTTGGFKYNQTGSKSIGEDVAQGVSQDFTGYLSGLQEIVGENVLSNLAIAGGFNDKYEGGYYIRTQVDRQDSLGYGGEKTFKFDMNNPQSKYQAYQDVVIESLRRKEQLTPELEKEIRGYNPANISSTALGVGGAGNFQIQDRVERGDPFKDFVDNYRNQQEEGAA